LKRLGAVRPVEDEGLAGADAEVGAQFLIALEALCDGAVGAAVVFQVFLPFRKVEFLDAAGDRVEEVLVDPEAFGFVLVAEEEIGVLPAVALFGRRFSGEEAFLDRVFADRVVPVEELDGAGAGVLFGQGGDRAEEVFAAARALQVVEDLDRTGASEEPRRSPSCGTPPKISWASAIPATWTTARPAFWVETLTMK
jgi:hypothetical protein